MKVTRIEIKDLTPPADITEAMARQMKAERLKRAQILEAEGDRASAILKAEGLKQSQILEAEGRREAAFRDAEARERAAEAEAKATEVVSEAIAKGDVNAINYFLGLKYVEAFAKLASSPQQRTVIVPADFAGLVGAIEGVKALTDNVKRVAPRRNRARRRGGSPFVDAGLGHGRRHRFLRGADGLALGRPRHRADDDRGGGRHVRPAVGVGRRIPDGAVRA